MVDRALREEAWRAYRAAVAAGGNKAGGLGRVEKQGQERLVAALIQ